MFNYSCYDVVPKTVMAVVRSEEQDEQDEQKEEELICSLTSLKPN